MKDYWDLIRAHKSLLGGHIWDWKDQGLARYDEHGVKSWGYGGDYERDTDPNSGNFCCNGIVSPDGTPKPAMWTCKYVYQPVEFTMMDKEGLRISLKNRNFHRSTEGYVYSWEIKDEEGVIQSGELEVPVIFPGESVEVSVPAKKISFKSGAVYMLNLYSKESVDLPYAAAGHSHSSEQFVLNERVSPETPSAKGKGLGSSDFSMNKPGGRCEKCQGTGKIEIDLKYLPESYIECPVCKGKRFQERVLEVTFNGYTINDVLDTPVEEIKDAFKMNKDIYGMLLCMEKLGLGYISLGQASMTLSGGEAQRVKLAKALGTKSTGNGLYLLDEPTSGLSESDIERLKAVLNELADGKNTVILIEHNLEFITAISDYMIDLGSVAGNEGGTTVIQGDPEKVVSDKSSSWQESPLVLLANNSK
jgi:ABC-type uncharacterized transport system ATPase subunit